MRDFPDKQTLARVLMMVSVRESRQHIGKRCIPITHINRTLRTYFFPFVRENRWNLKRIHVLKYISRCFSLQCTSGYNPSEIAIPALNQGQVDMFYREGRYPLLLPLLFLIRSDLFTDPEYADLVSAAIYLSQITDNTTADKRYIEPQIITDVRTILTKYLVTE
jgi:hypothetical protein